MLHICGLLHFYFLAYEIWGCVGVSDVHDKDHHQLADPQLTGIAMSMFTHVWS